MLGINQQKELLQTRRLKAGGGVHDPDFGCFRNVISENPHILDVGANRGQSIVSFKAVLPQSSIDSFEANPFFFPILDSVAKWFDGITIHNYGLGATEASLEFFVPVVDGSAYLEEGSTKRESFERKWVKERLASYGSNLEFDTFSVEVRAAISVLGDKAVDIVKIDVEGAEMDVLSSMVSLIEHSHPIFLIENSDFNNVTQFLSGRGYDCFQYIAETNSLVP